MLSRRDIIKAIGGLLCLPVPVKAVPRVYGNIILTEHLGAAIQGQIDRMSGAKILGIAIKPSDDGRSWIARITEAPSGVHEGDLIYWDDTYHARGQTGDHPPYSWVLGKGRTARMASGTIGELHTVGPSELTFDYHSNRV